MAKRGAISCLLQFAPENIASRCLPFALGELLDQVFSNGISCRITLGRPFLACRADLSGIMPPDRQAIAKLNDTHVPAFQRLPKGEKGAWLEGHS